jgi:hypothetical protein
MLELNALEDAFKAKRGRLLWCLCMSGEVSFYCRLLEKTVRLKRSGRLVEGCSETACPMRRSVNCPVGKTLEAYM